MTEIERATADPHRRRLAAMSNALVRLHARHYGKGPTRARTFVFDHFALCLLYEPFTTAETTMLLHGEETAVRDNRLLFYRRLERDFRAAVEDISGRRTTAFMPQISFEPPVISALFLFESDEPEGRL